MTQTDRLERVPLAQIDVSADQNRTVFDERYLGELAASIAENGVLTPISVRPGVEGRFVLVAGECRTRAARLAGLETIPAYVRELDDASALVGTLVENVARRDPDPIDEAAGYNRALEHGVAPDVAGLARRVGVRASRVETRLALLRLGDLAQARIRTGELKLTYAAAMVGLDANRQLLALHAYAHVPTPPIDAFRLQCERWRDDQSAEGMTLLDADAFLQVDEWSAAVAAATDDEVNPVDDKPIGVNEIAELFEVRPATVHKWRERGQFIDPSGSVSGTPWWWHSKVMDWAKETGRL